MNIKLSQSMSPLGPRPTAPDAIRLRPAPPSTQSQRTFAEILGAGDRLRPADEDRAQKAAEELVAVTFIEPILREAREVRSGEGLFGVTEAEKQFGAMLDANAARDMVRSWDFPLVDRLARDMRAAAGVQENP